MRRVESITQIAFLAFALVACPAHSPNPRGVASSSPARSEDLRISALRTSIPLYPLAAIGRTSTILNQRKIRLASDGAVEYDYGALYGRSGWQFNPVTTASLCISAYNDYAQTSRPALRALTLREARALIHRAKRGRYGIVWRYGFANEDFGAARGWLSSMAQGLGAACLSGAGALTHTRQYLDSSAAAIGTLTAPDGSDGTAVALPHGVWYEEVAGGGSQPSHILNGMIFALGGIWLANEVDPRPAYSAALRNGLVGIRSLIDSFSTPGASLYDLRLQGLAPLGGYNLRHVEQLQWLYEQTHDPHFLDVAFRYLEYERRLPARIEASAANAQVVSIPNDGHCRSFAPFVPLKLTVTFPATVAPDRVVLVGCRRTGPPAQISVMMGGVETRAAPAGRFTTVSLPPRASNGATILLVPKSGGTPGFSLASFTTPAQRRLTALSGDIGSYFDPSRTPLNVADGLRSTAWSTGRTDAWLLATLGDGRVQRISVTECVTHPPASITFSADLSTWAEPSLPSTSTPVPAEARYLLLRWTGAGGCLVEIT